MTKGVIAELHELIDLKRYAQIKSYIPLAKAVQTGANSSRLRGRGMDFSEVRNYQAGDDIRHMEWRMTARTGRPHVKIYQEEKEHPVVLLVDFNPSMIFGTRIAFKSVIAARLAALIAWTVVQHGDRIGGVFFSATQHNEFTPRSRDRGVLTLLSALASYSKDTVTNREEHIRPMSEALVRIRRVVRPGSIIILISDFYSFNEESLKYLKQLNCHHDLLAYHINDPVELSSPKPACYPITNGKEHLILDTQSPSMHTAYNTLCTTRIQHLDNQFKTLGIPYTLVTGETDLVHLVRRAFSRKKNG